MIGAAGTNALTINCCRWSTRSCVGSRARQLRPERAGHTLQPTALVHEAYLRLVDQRRVDWRSRAHFFGVAAQVMRRILVDDARRHSAAKRGDGSSSVCRSMKRKTQPPRTTYRARTEARPSIALAAVDRGLGADRRIPRVRRPHHRGGGVCAEGVAVDGKREWRTAKAWLTRELGAEPRP